MASLDQVVKQAKTLSTEEIDQLQKELKSIKKEIEEKEGQEKAGKWKKEVSIDDKIQFRRAGKTVNGTVEAVLREGVKVQAEGGKRARTVKWHEITSKK